MDLWAWVNETERRLREQGHTRLAELIDRIPSETVDDRHDRVDAMVPEALALAESMNEPWLEVFLRHWWLQSKILHRMDGSALGEAVALVDLAHRDETRGCPQSVCAVQDLAAAYGHVDGPGFANERFDVAQETLARIDPSWACFTCISTELAGALFDRGDVAESLAFLDRQSAVLVAAGQSDAACEMPRTRIDALLVLGRLEDALAFVERLEKHGRDDDHHRVMRRIDRARILVRLGRAEEARDVLPDVSEVRPTPFFYGSWTDAVVHLVRAGVLPNEAALGAVLQGLVERLDRQGIGRTTLEIAETHARLALDRGAPHVARRALAMMERASSRLHRPLDALDRIGKVRAALEAAPPIEATPLPDEPAALLAAVEEQGGRDRERDLLLLEAAHARFPADRDVALVLAGCQYANGLEAEAIATLDALHSATGDDEAALRLGDLLLRRADELAELVRRHRALAKGDESRAIGAWLLARAAHARRDFSTCRAELEEVLRARPSAVNARALYAEAARELGDLEGALAKLDEIVELVPEGGPFDWDRMLVATLLGDHARVRESAKRVGFELEGEGPIVERFGLCRIRYDREGAELWALRISPVTARILEIVTAPRPQHYGDVVAFDAQPLNPPPATPEERDDYVPVYPFVATVEQGDFRAFTIDGVHPGDEIVDAMKSVASDRGGELQVLSGDTYVVGEAAERGLFAALAIPSGADLAAACAALASIAGERKLAFVDLARAAGDEPLAAAHARLIEELAL